MDKQEKEFILNKGLILGLVLMLFPIIDLMYGLNMSTTNSVLVFGLLWLIGYTFLLVKWSKEFAFKYDVFSFKDSFRVLYIISALGFVVLTVGKIGLWNVYSPNTYIEINLNRAQKIYDVALIELNIPDSIRQGVIEGYPINAQISNTKLNTSSSSSDSKETKIFKNTERHADAQREIFLNEGGVRHYDVCPPEFKKEVNYIRSLLQTVQSWQELKRIGIPKSHFIALLIPVLFLNSIFCAILALFVRKKEQFIKTN